MEEHKPYDPEVYKRLELVRKQFKRHAEDQKKQEIAGKYQVLADWLVQNKHKIIRWSVYVFLGLLVLGVIGVAIAEAV